MNTFETPWLKDRGMLYHARSSWAPFICKDVVHLVYHIPDGRRIKIVFSRREVAGATRIRVSPCGDAITIPGRGWSEISLLSNFCRWLNRQGAADRTLWAWVEYEA